MSNFNFKEINMYDFNKQNIEEFRGVISKLKDFCTDPQWFWTLKYDVLINPFLGSDIVNYIDKLQLNELDSKYLENIMVEIKEKSERIMKLADQEQDVVKKWFLYRFAYAYYGFLEVIIEGSVVTNEILSLFKKKYGDSYLDILKKIDNINPSELTGFNGVDGNIEGVEVNLYLLMKKWQDIEHVYHNNNLIKKHTKAKNDFEKYIHNEYPYLSDIKGRNLIGIHLLNTLPIINMDQLFKFFDIEVDGVLSNIIGGKNLGLAKLAYNDVSIPTAYAISVDSVAKKRYLNEINNLNERRYSIRSSATVADNKNQSFAGLFKTNLNVTKANIPDSIDDVFTSVLSDRVKKYCEKFGTKKPYMSVVIQNFDEPEYSGVWLGNSINSGHLEWTHGNGEKLVSGKVTPTYENWDDEVDNPFTVDNIAVGKVCIDLQHKLNTISDFEWCVVNGKLLFVQFRPVTVKFNLKNTVTSNISDKIVGIPASTGVVKGVPNYLDDVNDISKFNKGEILLADFTDPDWVPAMIESKGIVTAEGGFLSHSAIISRELGIPCVTGVGYSNIENLSNSKEIIVDGTNGIVEPVKKLTKKK